MSKFFITGATGFVGSYVCNKLLEDGHKVIALVRKDFSAYSNLDYYSIKDNIDIARGDLTVYESLQPIITKYKPDVIINFAAQAIVKVGIENPVLTFNINSLGTQNILETVRHNHDKIKLFIQMSTDKVFGSKLSAKDNSRYSVTCPYSASKIAAENICKSYRSTYDIPITIIRSCNLYGPGDFNRRVIPNTIEQILRENKTIIFNGDDKRFREYIHVEDLYSAISFIINHQLNSNNNYQNHLIEKLKTESKFTELNISPSSGTCYSTEDVVKLIIDVYYDLTGKKVIIDKIKRDEFIEIYEQSLDGKTLFELGWNPKYPDFKNGLYAACEWYINHPDYFSKIRYR